MRVALLLTVMASSAAADEVFFVDPDQFAAADVVIAGEIHNQRAHHLTQAEIITAVSPTAVIFEMLTADQAALATPDHYTSPDLGARLNWSDAGWPAFELYAPIFAALGDAVVIGAAPDADLRANARDNGAAAAINDPAYGLDKSLPESEQNTREAGMQASHCGQLPPEMLGWFVDQQRFADATFTRATLDALATYGAPVVVITGNGHARTDWGMPIYLNRAAPDIDVISFGQVIRDDSPTPYDLWRVNGAPIPGDDPCAAFQ